MQRIAHVYEENYHESCLHNHIHSNPNIPCVVIFLASSSIRRWWGILECEDTCSDIE